MTRQASSLCGTPYLKLRGGGWLTARRLSGLCVILWSTLSTVPLQQAGCDAARAQPVVVGMGARCATMQGGCAARRRGSDATAAGAARHHDGLVCGCLRRRGMQVDHCNQACVATVLLRVPMTPAAHLPHHSYETVPCCIPAAAAPRPIRHVNETLAVLQPSGAACTQQGRSGQVLSRRSAGAATHM